MKIKGVIFDMDGLMIDTEKLLYRFWGQAAKLYGFEIKFEDYLGMRSLAAKFAEPKLKTIYGADFDYMKIRETRKQLMNAYIAENGIEMKKGLDVLLRFLKENGYKVGVATATDSERTERYLTSIGVYEYFDKITCANEVENGKPYPDIYLLAAKRLGLSPNECLALEDSPNGIVSAYKAGCVPVMIPDLSEPDKDTLALCKARLDSLDLVIDYLKNIN